MYAWERSRVCMLNPIHSINYPGYHTIPINRNSEAHQLKIRSLFPIRYKSNIRFSKITGKRNTRSIDQDRGAVCADGSNSTQFDDPWWWSITHI